MRLFVIACVAVLAVTSACSNEKHDGRADCTLRAIGAGTGSATLHATLMVPDTLLHGVEISNGGVQVLSDDCDFVLNALISDESANQIIEDAPKGTLWDRAAHSRRLVEASLSIWKFSDGSGEPRFFVMGVQDMAPILRARTAHESEYYRLDAAPL